MNKKYNKFIYINLNDNVINNDNIDNNHNINYHQYKYKLSSSKINYYKISTSIKS